MKKFPYNSLTVFSEGGITQIGFSPVSKVARGLFLRGGRVSNPAKNKTRNIGQVLRDLVLTGLGTGYSPWGPGTMGTVLAVPIVYFLAQSTAIIYMVVTLLLTLGSIVLTDWYESEKNSHDNSEIVIDEILGYMITMFLLPMTAVSLIAGFILFRLLDIYKPYPINYIDKHVKGGTGVIGDDILAGIIANIILQIVYAKTNWLFF